VEAAEYRALNELEDRYWWHAGLRDLTLSMARQYLRAGPAPAILDLGCGTGGNLAALRRELPQSRLHGADLSPLAVSFAQERGEGVLCRASANALPYPDAAFDAVFALDVFYAAEVDEGRAFRECRRVLKEGGILFVNLPAFEWLRGSHDAAVHTRQRYTAHELKGKLASAGYVVLRVTYWNTLLFPLVLAWRRALRRVLPDGTPRSDLVPLPGAVNGVLKLVLRLERAAFAGIDLPFGSSVFAVARKAAG
jgi:SAM-dependent methyltransferase